MKIWSDIAQRSSAELDIRYFDGESTAKHLVVPITPACRRRFRLMQEDCIEVQFSLAEAVHITIGDYVQDEIFGFFFITEEQMPKYNTRTGGYDYTLRFDAPYMRWKNHLHCLVANGERKETSWRLTDRLVSHAQAIIDNVHIIFPPTTEGQDIETGTSLSSGYAVSIENVEMALEAHFIDFNGKDIISALNDIAGSYECEWWVDDEHTTIGSVTYMHTLHFGKCEDSGQAYAMSIGDNVESMEVSRDQQTFANRIYVYGGTQNIPDDYGKRLIFTNTNTPRQTTFKDSARELSLDMILGEGNITPTQFTLGTWSSGGTNPKTYTQNTGTLQLNGTQTFDINLQSVFTLESDDWAATDIPDVECRVILHYGANAVIVRPSMSQLSGIGARNWYADIVSSKEIQLGSSLVNVYLEIVWSVTFAQYSSHVNDNVLHETSGTMTATKDASSATKEVKVGFNGSEYTCTFSGETKAISPKPTGLTQRSQYTINNLNLLKVPQSYYTAEYDVSGMRYIGDRRLHLPGTTRYVENVVSDASQRVEMAVIFDKVFPRLDLRIKSGTMGTQEMTQKIEHQDGSITYEKWTQYSFVLERTDGTAFDFKVDYLLDGHKLQGVFSAPQNIDGQTGFKLAGMTFDLGYESERGRFTIIRNEDYGALLPNQYLFPSEGDTLVLTGWNPRAISEMGLVDEAELLLSEKGTAYLNAIQEGQFTFNAHMMSKSMMAYPFRTGSDKAFGLLLEGCKVAISHDALPGGSKTSRVLGYEYKLDMPFDTPTYIVGETEAYSRLKKLEKEITKL